MKREERAPRLLIGPGEGAPGRYLEIAVRGFWLAIGRGGAAGMLGLRFWSISAPFTAGIKPLHWRMPPPIFSVFGWRFRTWSLRRASA